MVWIFVVLVGVWLSECVDDLDGVTERLAPAFPDPVAVLDGGIILI